MPLTKKGHKIMAAMKEQYGEEEGERVFYASANAGKIAGVHRAKDAVLAVTDADGCLRTHGVHLADDDTLLDAVTKHRDGYLTCEARVARTGVQRYRGYEVGLPDRENVVLYRPPEEVFARDSMRSMANKPITLTHPKQMVDSKSWSKVAKGFSGSEVVRDGEFVRVPLMLTDAAAVEAFEKGAARELSVGYTTDIDWTAGTTPDGAPYDGVQRQIRGNHHALVPVARGGDRLRFGDAWSDQARQAALEARRGRAQGYLRSLSGAEREYGDLYHQHMTGEGGEPPRPMAVAPATSNMIRQNLHSFYTDAFDDLQDDWSDAARQAAAEARRQRGEVEARVEKFKQYGGSGVAGTHETPEEEAEIDKDIAEMRRRQRFGGGGTAKVSPQFRRAMEMGSQGMDADSLTCPNCGAPVQEGARSCPTCGYDIKPTPRSDDASAYNDGGGDWLADRDVGEEERKSLAEKGHALPGGGYPIRNRSDLGNAIKAFGRAKNPAATKALIKRRAKELGATGMLPEDWRDSASDAAVSGMEQEVSVMPIIRTFDGVPISFADEISAATMEREMRKLQLLADQGAKNFGGKKAKPFGKNGNGDDDEGGDDADEIEAKRKKQTQEDALKVKDGEIAVLKKQLADAKLTDAQVHAMVAERQAVIDTAQPLLPKGFAAADKSLADIRRAAVGVSLGDSEIKDWDDAQVTGAFMALTKTGGQKRGAQNLADGMSKGMRDSQTFRADSRGSLSDAENEAAKAHAEYVKNLTDAYKHPLAVVRN